MNYSHQPINHYEIFDEITVHERITRSYQRQRVQAGLPAIWKKSFFKYCIAIPIGDYSS